MPMGNSHQPRLNSPILTSPREHLRARHRRGKKGKKVLGSPMGEEKAIAGTPRAGGRDAEDGTGGVSGNLSISFVLVFLKTNSEAAEEEEWEGTRVLGEREDRQASGQQPEKQLLTTRPEPGKNCGASPRPRGTRARGSAGRGCADPPPAAAPQLRTPLVQGARRYARPCLPGDDLAKLLGGRREEGWGENKALREHALAQNTLGDTGVPAHTKPRPCSFAPGQRQQKPHDSGWFSRAEKHDQARRTGSTGSAAQPLGHCPHTGTPLVRVTCAWQLPGDAPHPSCPAQAPAARDPFTKPFLPGELFVSAVTSRCSLNSFGVSCRELCQELQ